MGRRLTKMPEGHTRTAKPKTSLHSHGSGQDQCILVLYLQQGPYIVWANSEDPDQTARIRSLV